MVSHFSRLNPPLVYCSLILYSMVLLSHGEAQVMAHNLRPGQLPLKCWGSCSSQAVVTQNHQSCDRPLKPLASPHDCPLSHTLLSSESLLSSSVCWTWLYQELLWNFMLDASFWAAYVFVVAWPWLAANYSWSSSISSPPSTGQREKNRQKVCGSKQQQGDYLSTTTAMGKTHLT